MSHPKILVYNNNNNTLPEKKHLSTSSSQLVWATKKKNKDILSHSLKTFSSTLSLQKQKKDEKTDIGLYS